MKIINGEFNYGEKIQVDLEAHCGHRKTMRMGFPQNQRDPSKTPEDWQVSTLGVPLAS